MKPRVGIDIGGTFTDLFLADGGTTETFKVLSTPDDPSAGVVRGLGLMAEARGEALEEFAGRVGLIVHGTTVTTNAVLTRGGSKTGLLTTQGVRDALEMRRGVRERQYDNRYENVVPLVPRWLRLPVQERLDAQGAEVAPLDEAGVEGAIEALRAEGVEAVAICFLHSYANPAHEAAAAELVARRMPEVFLSVSSSILPTVRFYERVSTTVLGAYVGPVLSDYLANLTDRLAGIGFGGVLLIMQSAGGVAAPATIAAQPATTLLSGPAAGPRAAAAFAEAHGARDCILVDMGGTSFDASLVRDGTAALATSGEIDRLRIALPMLEINTIGAGGGSIGWIDAGGLLRMGPASAGAMPGPACYGRGGSRPTCTDADLVLGYLDPGFFAGGRLQLDAAASRRAIERDIAQPLGLDVETAAAGMYRVINAHMANGVREITVKRGLDPREFTMVVAGGAGPLHACSIAAELEMGTLLVPPTASVLCASGMLLCDLQHDRVRSCVGRLDEPGALEAAAELARAMCDEGAAELAAEGAEHIEHEVAFDLRYLKQYHDVTLAVPADALAAGDIGPVARAFHAEHDRLYGYELSAEGTPLELINVRVRSIGRTEKPRLPEIETAAGPDAGAALKGRRRAYVPEIDAFDDVPVYDGHALRADHRLAGPALVERADTTLFVTAGATATVDRHGGLFVKRAGAS